MDLEKELRTFAENFREDAPPDVIAALDSVLRDLARTGIAERALRRGGRAPDFALSDPAGRTVRSTELLARGPMVVSFYRGSWCPYCSLELRALQERLDDIRAKGATLVAISPQTPDASLTMQEKHALAFPVLSDPGNRVARAFGLVFALDERARSLHRRFGIELPEFNGDESHELPLPATYVVAPDGTIVDAFVPVDYRERLAPETVIEWLDRAISTRRPDRGAA